MILVTEGQIINLVNVIVNFAKVTYIFPGFSLFYANILLWWIGAAMFLWWFTVRMLGGSSD